MLYRANDQFMSNLYSTIFFVPNIAWYLEGGGGIRASWSKEPLTVGLPSEFRMDCCCDVSANE